MTAAELVIVLAAFLLCATWSALMIGRALRDRTDRPETVGNLILLTALFALLAMVGVRVLAPVLDRILTVWR